MPLEPIYLWNTTTNALCMELQQAMEIHCNDAQIDQFTASSLWFIIFIFRFWKPHQKTIAQSNIFNNKVEKEKLPHSKAKTYHNNKTSRTMFRLQNNVTLWNSILLHLINMQPKLPFIKGAVHPKLIFQWLVYVGMLSKPKM